MNPVHPAEDYTKADLEHMLQAMRDAASEFYSTARRIGNHPFIEFAGMMNEYIGLCQDAHAKGIDFTRCNRHSGSSLPLQSHNFNYIAEKLDCIFSGQIKVLAGSSVSDPKRFSLGDRVVWTSQAGGRTKIKTGQVVAVVRERDYPQKCIPSGFRLYGPGKPRDHRSYLVQVGASKNLYWPRVSQMRLATD